MNLHSWNWSTGFCINCGASVNDPSLSGACPMSPTPSPYVAGNAPTPSISPGLPTLGGWFGPPPDDFAAEDPTPVTPVRNLCLSCERELCEALDAYYGSDLIAANQCVDCRHGRTPAKA